MCGQSDTAEKVSEVVKAFVPVLFNEPGSADGISESRQQLSALGFLLEREIRKSSEPLYALRYALSELVGEAVAGVDVMPESGDEKEASAIAAFDAELAEVGLAEFGQVAALAASASVLSTELADRLVVARQLADAVITAAIQKVSPEAANPFASLLAALITGDTSDYTDEQ